MNLTDFLLARIAEDEAVAHPLANADTRSGLREGSREYVEATPARVLAECEAKRRIVERHGGKHVCPTPPDEWHRYEGGERVDYEIPCGDLRDLAAPFADHPDYREEWAL